MKLLPLGLAVPSALLVCGIAIGFGQSPEQAGSDAVRVTVSMHPDGSRTIYNFDNAQHKAVATTTDVDGKVRETIRYELDDGGRFASAEISGPDGRLRRIRQTSRRKGRRHHSPISLAKTARKKSAITRPADIARKSVHLVVALPQSRKSVTKTDVIDYIQKGG